GNGTVAKSPPDCLCQPLPEPVSQLTGAVTLAASLNHAISLLADGSVSTWGSNSEAQLGIGVAEDKTPHPAPIRLQLRRVSAVAAGQTDAFALIGATQSLAVSFAGAGAGAGVVGGENLLCPPSCDARFPVGRVVNLRAEGSQFAGFSGACKGTGPCQATLSQ